MIGTMADEAYDAHRFRAPASARVLGGVEPVELSRHWTAEELARFRKHGDDRRLRGAHRGGGGTSITEYLAVGPELGHLWRRARRARVRSRGHYLVRAAIDLARCGARGGIPVDVLRRAHELYVGGWPYTPEESFEAGLAWATEVRLGVTGMLVMGGASDTWMAFGSLVAEVEDQGPEADLVPLKMWPCALEAVWGDEGGRTRVITRARQYRPHEAMKWFRKAADRGYEDVAITIGNLFRDWREPEEAETWYRRAMAHGDAGATNNLALILEDLGEPTEEIERLFRMAAEAGEISAPVNLGYSAKARGDWDEARRWFEEGHARGAYSGAFALGQLEWERGNAAAAEEWFGKALEMGNHAAEQAIAMLKSEGGEAAANVEA
ncbi:tetratricopeptide repeat protein [Streptomyces sp. NPDC057136]|uniref:tetratricopeptide repeat protein n=1 Tax=Streptomyces sp. NPDC057136 TaxID=3346029 RepID=UPI00363A741F